MPPSNDYDTRRALVHEVKDALAAEMQGTAPDRAEVHEDKPSNMFPSGALFPPESEENLVEQLESEFGATEYRPSALGFSIVVPRKDAVELDLSARLKLFYPVHPTHREVLTFLERFAPKDAVVELPPKYKRIDVEIPSTRDRIVLRPTNRYEVLPDATAALARALDRARVAAEADPRLYGVAKGKRRTAAVLLSTADLRNPDWYDSHVAACTRRSEPQWNGNVRYRVRESDEGWVVDVLVCNNTGTRDAALESVFIGVVLEAAGAAGDLVPSRLREVEARDFRHDPTCLARGRNCDTVAEAPADARWRVVTDSVPVFVQRRLVLDADRGKADPTFAKLATPEGAGVLEKVLEELRDYLAAWDDKARASGRWDAEHARQGKEAFAREVSRYESGLRRLRDPTVARAFQLMNASFHARWRHDSRAAERWRRFQLVFIVSEIDRVVGRVTDPAWKDVPTVLWFPTGGGKTEAYLGLVVFHAFYDRVRGKPFGTTAIAKFPLRMLSIQQFARVVAVFEHAENVRRDAPGVGGEPFSVGYYAGEGNTLNVLDVPVSPDRAGKPSAWSRSFAKKLGSPKDMEREERRHRKVATCPVCFVQPGKPGAIATRFDAAKPGFRHTCQNPSCRRELGLHVTDTEVLRWLPTLVIATIDKMARLAAEPWGRVLFGETKAKCTDHGFLLTVPVDAANKPVWQCPVLSCGKPLSAAPPNVDPGPALLVQDELHLLTESLGAFASHYETMLVATMKHNQGRGIGKGPWHVVGSTATIEGYRHLVRQLYNRGEATRLPEPGPTTRESFYARESDEEQRIVVGVRPHGMTHVDAVMKLLLVYHRTLWPLVDPAGAPGKPPPASVAGLSPSDQAAVARFYRTSLTYGINRNEIAQVNLSFTGQLNPMLQPLGYRGFDPERVPSLTGDNEIGDIQDFLDAMTEDVPDWPQAATATSIVSHGVDLDYLNFMVFRGMPHRMTEYIQASSRVGRKKGVPALVVNVYNPNRERDGSHFEAHKDYLRLREVLIRNIPTTRFSVQALERTVPGLMLHHVNYRSDPIDLWKKTTVDGLLKAVTQNSAEFVDAVREGLGIPDAPDPDSPFVKRQAELAETFVMRVKTDLLRASSPSSEESNWANDRLRVLKSLRDVDVQIDVYSGGSLEEV